MATLSKYRIELVLFLFTFITYGYFYGGGTWGQNSRLNAIFAFVEPNTAEHLTFRIDRFMADPETNYNTGDYSVHDGHFYSNKSPGVILMAVPVYFALYYGEKFAGINPDIPVTQIFNAYIINLFVTVLAMAIAVVFFYKLVLELVDSKSKATLFTCILAFGTLLFPYSTMLWSHTTAAAFGILGLYGILKRTRNWSFVSGVCVGMVFVCDFLGAMIVVALSIYALIHLKGKTIYYVLGGHSACFNISDLSCL